MRRRGSVRPRAPRAAPRRDGVARRLPAARRSSSGCSRRPAHTLATGAACLLQRPSGFDLHSVRDYVEGDSLRKVHWRSTARRGQLMVKELEDSPRDDVAVVLDAWRGCPRARLRRRRARGRLDPPDATRAASRRAALVLGGATRRGAARPGRGRLAPRARAARRRRGRRSGGAGAAARRRAEPRRARARPRRRDAAARRGARRPARSSGPRRGGTRRSSTSTATPRPRAALLRLQAAGVAVAVLREGDDLGRRARRSRVRGGGACLGWRPALVCSRAGRRADAELAPARAPAAGRLARAPAARARASRRRSRRARGSASSSSRSAVFVAIARCGARASRTIRGAPPPRLWDGFLDCYDVRLPFDPSFHPDLHALLLLAGFGFAAGRRARRVVRAGRSSRSRCSSSAQAGPRRCSPTTATSSAAPSILGDCAVPARRACASTRCRRSGAPRSSAPALVAAALAAATQPAVAKSEFLHWQTWKPISRPPAQVGVRYVWDANYDGFTLAAQDDDRVEGARRPPRSLYWRATTLDLFTGARWVEYRQPDTRRSSSTAGST